MLASDGVCRKLVQVFDGRSAKCQRTFGGLSYLGFPNVISLTSQVSSWGFPAVWPGEFGGGAGRGGAAWAGALSQE